MSILAKEKKTNVSVLRYIKNKQPYKSIICQVNGIQPNMPAAIERRVDKVFSLVFFKSNSVKVQKEIEKKIMA